MIDEIITEAFDSANNLTALAGALAAVANTTQGMNLLLEEAATGNHTVFAPSNAAFAKLNNSIANDSTFQFETIAYHIQKNAYLPAGIAEAPGHTISRTFLSGDGFDLHGNKTPPVILSRHPGDTTGFFVQQAFNIVNATGPIMSPISKSGY